MTKCNWYESIIPLYIFFMHASENHLKNKKEHEIVKSKIYIF